MSNPNDKCPICQDYFRAPVISEDIARHYWWHKLEKLAVAPPQEAQE